MVRPPSRIAKRMPGSIATALSSVTWTVPRSPGRIVPSIPSVAVTLVVPKKITGA